MYRVACLALTVVLAAAVCVAGPAAAGAPAPHPAATFSQFQCTGFIASHRLPSTVRLYDGADNMLFEGLHSFNPRDMVYLRRSDGGAFQVGEAFSIVRPETGVAQTLHQRSGVLENQILPPTSRYPRQRIQIKSLGTPYDDAGLVRVVRLTPKGAIAKVIFTCTALNPGDLAIPYTPQSIPDYTPVEHLDQFGAPNGKLEGTIVAASAASAYLARGSIAFLNIGAQQGVRPGQRFRIFAVPRDNLKIGLAVFTKRPETPRETVGELVILHVQGKAAEGIVVRSLREIAVGDGVELD